MNAHRYRIDAMHCQGCVKRMRAAVQAEDVEAEVVGDPAEKRLDIDTRLDAEQVSALLTEAGYPPNDDGHRQTGSGEPDAAASGSPSADHPTPASDDSRPRRFSIDGMTCAGCVNAVQKALSTTTGVQHAQVDFAGESALVTGSASDEALIDAVRSAGYDATPVEDLQTANERRQQDAERRMRRHAIESAVSLALGLPLMLAMFVHTPALTGGERWLWFALGMATLGVLATAGRRFFDGAFKAFRHHQANMDTLIALGSAAAWLYSMAVVLFPGAIPEGSRHLYFEASLMIVGLIGLGQALELRARGRTSQALSRLLDLGSDTARVIREGRELDVDIDTVTTGERIRVRPGERLPVDGEVETGESYIDESMLTGEPTPVRKSAGQAVSAGTLNGQGSLVYRATQVGDDTRLGRIVDQVARAQASRPPIGALADRVSAVFVPSVMIAAMLTALIWFNVGPAPQLIHTLIAATTVLIIACPCALGLATPISTMIGIGKAAEHGVLVRDGEALQSASRLTTLVVDKTGTLTEGKPRVIGRHDESPSLSRAEIDAIVVALERRSEHPLAAALLAATHDADAITIRDFESYSGRGVTATLDDGRGLWLGNEAMMSDAGIDLTGLRETTTQWQQQAASVIYLGVGDALAAAFAVRDPLRDDSQAAIARIQAAGLRVVMLSGDSETAARAIATEAGIDEVHAGLLPADKQRIVEMLQGRGERVGMVGDGINDAPALAQAEVGFAIGHGTDVAIESAGMTLMRDSLHGVADAIAISRATLANIRQNLWGAFGYNALGIPIAAGVLYPITGALLSPLLAALAMSLSSVTVVSNANRLRWFDPERQRPQATHDRETAAT
ncbi:heavy metal translocating P-type ATPase [Salinicola aestuarinus]|uniref:heavy metal translocating P-type ATPase n=1 Tax=Salinicola aestuarinus TaxID=1949082 RepID=UPI001FD95249|nr:heavy metal translocating P-type ATPase [Salinicola aestuarinus]